MNVLQRLTDILSANVNELIERYEDPELLLKQAVREMEESIRVALNSAARVIADEKILTRQLAREESAVAACRQRAENAAQRGDDAVAIEALRQKREREVAATSLTRQLAEVTDAAQSLRRQIETMRRRVDEAQRKLVLLAARQRAAAARRQLLREFSDVSLSDDAFRKFDRMCRKVEQTEFETEALAELTRDSGTCLAVTDLDDRAREEELAAELRELKAKCGRSTDDAT